MGGSKLRYEISLAGHAPTQIQRVEGLRTIRSSDLEDLAALMLDAYRGTIDYSGQGIGEAIDAVQGWFDGEPLLNHSFLIERDASVASAVLVMRWEARPFIGWVMTAAAAKGQGLAKKLVATSLRSLADQGHETVVFYITEGNEPSERLFASFGARHVPE